MHAFSPLMEYTQHDTSLASQVHGAPQISRR